MYKLLLAITFLTMPYLAMGSTMTKSLSTPRVGDSLVMQKVNYAAIADTGKNCLWDLSDCETGPRIPLKIDSFADRPGLLVALFKGKRNYFLNLEDSLVCVGYEKPGEVVIYSRPSLYLPYGAASHDRLRGTLSGNGELYERTNTCVFGTWICETSACGTFITPEADTLRNVTRVDTKYELIHRYSPRDSILTAPRDVDIVDSIALCANPEEISESRWYAPGFRYPVLTSITAAGETTSYITPTDVMKELFDPDNAEIREVTEANALDNYNKKESSMPGSQTTIDYTLRQDRDNRNVTIEYTASKDCEINFVLASVTGIVYKSQSQHALQGQQGSVTISYDDLPRAAAYGLRISTEEEMYQEKFMY